MNIPSDMQPHGNSINSLPTEYIPCSFLNFNANSVFDTNYTTTPDTGFSFDIYVKKDDTFRVLAGSYDRDKPLQYIYVFFTYTGKVGLSIDAPYYPLRDGGYANSAADASGLNSYTAEDTRILGMLNWKNDNHFMFNLGGEILRRKLPSRFSQTSSQLAIGNGMSLRPIGHAFVGRLYRFAISQGSKLVRDFIPVLSVAGDVCLYDRSSNSSPLLNTTGTQPIPGFTLTQARKLARLSDGGGNLTIQLPAGWDAAPNVILSLEIAKSKGWTISVQTLQINNRASTYSLRRGRSVVWCRKTACPDGLYVANDGSRCQIEWCSAIYSPHGNNPLIFDYEAFDSIESATEFWQLQTYAETR
ncbi:MAG: hypothetical protein IKJ58_04580 [Akkermansia sp.]|nr:hypothetical protein [Akkermansia sp.]